MIGDVSVAALALRVPTANSAAIKSPAVNSIRIPDDRNFMETSCHRLRSADFLSTFHWMHSLPKKYPEHKDTGTLPTPSPESARMAKGCGSFSPVTSEP